MQEIETCDECGEPAIMAKGLSGGMSQCLCNEEHWCSAIIEEWQFCSDECLNKLLEDGDYFLA